jgi:RHS repeat-associated protein
VIRFSAWDNWELLEEYGSGLSVAKGYLQGAAGVVKSWDPIYGQMYYYQDKLGSTTHVASASGALLESYHYDLYGTPSETSTHGVVDLYAGERWIPELGLYDLRNRFMYPRLGRFLQPDPIGFKGDMSNLHRYCHNDPENFADPMGLVEYNPEMTYSPLTMFGGGDWIKGSDGLSALDWNDRHRQAGVTMGLIENNVVSAAPGRAITAGEIREAKTVFGNKIDYGDVRIIDGKANPFQGSNYAVTIGNHVYWRHAPKDFAKLSGSGGHFLTSRFIHEMTHVMQHQHGINVVAKAIPLQAAQFLHLFNPYRGGAYDARKPFSSYNVEQQGDIAARIYEGELPKTIINYPDLR